MKPITLDEVIKDQMQRPGFQEPFNREMMVNAIAEMVVQTRKANGLTQEQLAERAHTTQPVIARIERGTDSRLPSIDLLERIARAVNARLNIRFDLPATE